MKRLLLLLICFSLCGFMYAGKYDILQRIGCMVAKNYPDLAWIICGFILDVVLMCIPVAIISGILSLILKHVFEFDKDQTSGVFTLVSIILLIICFILYFS